jgi:hypothetical protein
MAFVIPIPAIAVTLALSLLAIPAIMIISVVAAFEMIVPTTIALAAFPVVTPGITIIITAVESIVPDTVVSTAFTLAIECSKR